MATAAKSDLIVSKLTIGTPSVLIGGTATVSFSITNTGGGAAPGSVAGIYLTVNGKAVQIESQFVPALNANGGAYNSPNISATLPPNVAAGTYNLYVEADINRVIAEGNEVNNTRGANITVLPPRPDIVVSGLGNLVNPTVGGTFTINYAITNQFSAGAGSFQTRIYLSKNSVVEAGDPVLATFGDKSLAGWATRHGSVQVTLPGNITPGPYNLIAVTDFTNAVIEMREDNNVRVTGIQVVAPPKR